MTQPLAPSPTSITEGLAARFVAITTIVINLVTGRVRHARSDCWGVRITVPVENLINLWIMRQRNRIAALIARIQAGTQVPPRPFKPHAVTDGPAGDGPAGDGPAGDGRVRKPPGARLPTSFAWLCAVGQETRSWGVSLGLLMAEPQMKAMVIAHPQLARLLRPMLRMLGEPMPDWVPKPERRARRRRTGRKRASRRRADPLSSAGPQARETEIENSSPSTDMADASATLLRLIEESRARQRASMAPSPPAPPPAQAAPALREARPPWQVRYAFILKSRDAGV